MRREVTYQQLEKWSRQTGTDTRETWYAAWRGSVVSPVCKNTYPSIVDDLDTHTLSHTLTLTQRGLLVCALSSVNHKGLHQGCVSLYPQVIHFTSHHTTSHVFSLFIFRVHSTREPASSRVTYFILQAYTGTGGSHSQHREKNRERFWKKCRWMDRQV